MRRNWQASLRCLWWYGRSGTLATTSAKNAKCQTFFTKEDDGLKQDWENHRVFCNPPYGRTMREWARKCYEASQRGALVVLLAHARTDTRWFQDWVYGRAHEIRFVRGRLKFGDGTQSAPFPSMIAIFRPANVALITARVRR